jgi:hypothetical protein
MRSRISPGTSSAIWDPLIADIDGGADDRLIRDQLLMNTGPLPAPSRTAARRQIHP